MAITKAHASDPYYPVDPVTARDIPGDGPALLVGLLQIGADGAQVTGVLSATTAWTPGVIADKASVSKILTVAGAVVGNTVEVGVYPALPAGVVASGQVTAGNTVTITLANLSGAQVTLAAGTVRATVTQY